MSFKRSAVRGVAAVGLVLLTTIAPRLCCALLLLSVPTVSIAEPAQVPSSKAGPPADPNQKVCEDITQIGSRLATKRICATRSEWEQKRRDDRDTVDEIQRSPCVLDESGHCGGH